MEKGTWSFIYPYNLRTVRDTFLYCAQKQKILEDDLYEDMKQNKIPPPKNKWINPNTDDETRLRLEYIHSTIYLGLIVKKQQFLVPDFSNLEKEKRIVIQEGQKRTFDSSKKSPSLSKAEKDLLIKTIFNYERARDFLRWFLDFEKSPNNKSFDENSFKKFAEPILLKGEKGKRGFELLKRKIDGKVYRIPNEKPHDYTRSAQLFPKWFKELEILDEVIVFPRFSKDKMLWHMYYPLKMSGKAFFKLDLFSIIKSLTSELSLKRIWIPKLLYLLASKYNCPIKAIKIGIENVCNQHIGQYYLERVPIHLVKRKYVDSYMEVDGFLRSYLKISES